MNAFSLILILYLENSCPNICHLIKTRAVGTAGGLTQGGPLQASSFGLQGVNKVSLFVVKEKVYVFDLRCVV